MKINYALWTAVKHWKFECQFKLSSSTAQQHCQGKLLCRWAQRGRQTPFRIGWRSTSRPQHSDIRWNCGPLQTFRLYLILTFDGQRMQFPTSGLLIIRRPFMARIFWNASVGNAPSIYEIALDDCLAATPKGPRRVKPHKCWSWQGATGTTGTTGRTSPKSPQAWDQITWDQGYHSTNETIQTIQNQNNTDLHRAQCMPAGQT